MVSSAQATLYASAGYMPVYLEMDNSSDTVLTKKLLFVLKSFAVTVCLAAIFIYYVIKNTPLDAESREKHDDGKHKFVGGTTAKLWPDFHKGVVINVEEK